MKFGAPAQGPQEVSKHIRFLISRGFAMDVVRKVVKGAND